MTNKQRLQNATEQCERLIAFGGGSKYMIENGMNRETVLYHARDFRQNHKMIANKMCNEELDSACIQLEKCLDQFDADMNNLLDADL